jgi:glutamate racemase
MSVRGADRPLGVFDSGLGGLTVVRALRAALPDEDILYLGDTARVPYGTKGPATVVKYALACARHLAARDVKAIVIACNTVSAVAPDRLKIEFDLPVLGAVEPGARAALTATKKGKIGVLATAGTVASGAYPRAVSALSTRAETVAYAAPLFVPLAEEGWTTGEVPRLAARKYLAPLAAAGVDVVVLGCTHYPLLRPVIEVEARELLGPDVAIVDSAEAAAEDVREFLASRGLARRLPPGAHEGGTTRLFVTDLPATFHAIADRFLGASAEGVEQVDL